MEDPTLAQYPAPENNGSAVQAEKPIEGEAGYVAFRVQELGLDPSNEFVRYALQLEAISTAMWASVQDVDMKRAVPGDDRAFLDRARVEVARDVRTSLPFAQLLKVARVSDAVARGIPLKISYPDELNANDESN